MTETMKTARHRSACRPTTPLTSFGQAVTGPMGRRAAVAAASSGIILSLGAPAVAAPTTDEAPVEAANLTAVADAAQALADDNVATAATVSVGADVNWGLGTTTEVDSEAPPEPEPEPEPEVSYERSTTETSRSNERTAAGTSESAETESTEAAPEAETDSGSVDASGIRAQIVDIAFRYVGTPYVLGGSTPAAFDCSGFTQYVFAQVGINLPRSSSAQRGAGQIVSAAEAKPGDLVWAPGHVGIYLGGDQHIAARNPSKPLQAGPIYMSNPTFIRVVG